MYKFIPGRNVGAYAQTIGFNWQGLILALIVGGFVGFSLPVGLANSPKIHKGFTL